MKISIGRLLLAALLSTVALLAWGMLYWQVLYQPAGVYHTLPQGDAVAAMLKQSNTPTGTYFYPWPRNTAESMEQFVEGHKQGGFFKMSYIREGVDPQSPSKLLGGALHFFIVSLMGCGLLMLSGAGTYLRRLLVIFLAGSIGTVFIQVGDPVWFHLPWDYPLGILLNELVSWLLMGAVLSWLVRR